MCATAQAERQKQWRARGQADAQATWRPVKTHRSTTKGCLIRSDNVIRLFTYFQGWVSFKYDVENQDFADEKWDQWPFCNLVIDMGGDMLCMSNAMLYFWLMNVTRWTDGPHGCHRDMGLNVSAMNLGGLWKAFMIVWNLEHGPNDDDERYNEIRAQMKQVYAEETPNNSPLFKHHCDDIASELERAGVKLDVSEGIDQAVWSYLRQQEDDGVKKGTQITSGRILNALAEAKCVRGIWSKFLWERS